MELLELLDLNHEKIPQKQWNQVITALAQGDWKAAQVKKMANANLYRAKLNDADRLLFKIVQYQDKKYLLLLEVIYQHQYKKSAYVRFESQIEESSLTLIPEIKNIDQLNHAYDEAVYINNESKKCAYLNKFISFDTYQENIYNNPLPLILIGSAGSGKTVLLLEKMKQLKGDILYVTQSSFLVENSRSLYYSNNYQNEQQNIDFLSFHEFLSSYDLPHGKEFTYREFYKWVQKFLINLKLKDPHKIFEEFRGVLTGNEINVPYLSRDEYLELGLKQSIFNKEEKEKVYQLFEKYLENLKSTPFYDSNILAFHYKEKITQKYDWVVIDEVQDLTNIQTFIILSSLRTPGNFLLCGDSNQIVHPNFFSWSHIKTLFFENRNLLGSKEIIRILHHNYRNSLAVIDMANRILKIKNSRFGSIDKESNYLIESISKRKGIFEIFKHGQSVLQEFDSKTKKSTKYAVIVMRNDDKISAKKFFQTPLIFSIEEAKGLEYQNVIIYNFVSSSPREFDEITNDISHKDLNKELNYSRAKDKNDKSLEVYKFYINAFYVAITRAIENVYLIEERSNHKVFNLLNLSESQKKLVLEKEESNWHEWQKEASKLELQGKLEQAEEIRQRVLQIVPVPWEVMSYPHFEKLKRETLVLTPNLGKKEKQLLFEFALIHNLNYLYPILAERGLGYAKKPQDNANYILSKHYLEYETKNCTLLLGMIQKYGVDFRHRFNQTPLMVAAILGNTKMATLLIDHGARKELLDNLGRTALQIALYRAITDKIYVKNYIAQIYPILMTSHISIKIGHIVRKIDAQKAEFFILNALIGIYHHLLGYSKNSISFPYFMSVEWEGYLSLFPSSVIPEFRKKRSYLNALLAKNEIDSSNTYGYKIFVRIARGQYVINPHLELEIGGEWMNVEEITHLHFWSDDKHKHEYDRVVDLIQQIKKTTQESIMI